jgi:hypothetical protein
MPLHLIKLAVGINDTDHLRERQRAYREEEGNLRHKTRMMPRRGAELLGGGSMYWVIRGSILVRNPIIDLRAEVDDEGRNLCVIELEDSHVLVRPTARRPFQGWRYLPADATPPDLARVTDAGVDPAMPTEMRCELSRLGLL